MLDKIIDLVKDQALQAITNNADVPAEKKDAAIDATTSALIDGFKDHFIPENLSSITNLLGGGSISGHSLTESLQTSVISALCEKVGINSNTATSIATIVVPAVIGLFSKKNSDSSEPSFNIQSLINAFSGGGGNSGGGILGAITKLFK